MVGCLPSSIWTYVSVRSMINRYDENRGAVCDVLAKFFVLLIEHHQEYVLLMRDEELQTEGVWSSTPVEQRPRMSAHGTCISASVWTDRIVLSWSHSRYDLPAAQLQRFPSVPVSGLQGRCHAC